MVEIALLLLIVGGGAWYILGRRQGLDAQAVQLRRDTVVRDAQGDGNGDGGQLLFDGSVAEVIDETVEAFGDDTTGPWLRVSSLCRMPDGSAWRVVVETARTDAEARSVAQKVPPAPL